MKINRNCLQTSARFGKRERHIIFEWIKTRMNVIIQPPVGTVLKLLDMKE